ncbi:MAG: hypothetical protein INR62_13220 [Rhodospirillales bacterium]|nr:hypothetical protein [Acetobacter sp.]
MSIKIAQLSYAGLVPIGINDDPYGFGMPIGITATPELDRMVRRDPPGAIRATINTLQADDPCMIDNA